MDNYANSIYLVRYSGPILDQGDTSACVPYSIAASMQLFMNRYNVNTGELSPMYLYAKIRESQYNFSEDAGSVPWRGPMMAREWGIPQANDYSNDKNNMYNHPDNSDDIAAYAFHAAYTQEHLVNPYASTEQIVNIIKESLSHANPVLMAFHINETISHQWLVVGADDKLNGGSYIVQNSWSSEWGVNGYGSITYESITTSNLLYMATISSVVKDGITYDNTWTYDTGRLAILYASVLNRVPDAEGFKWWIEQHNSEYNITSAFFNSPEYAALIPGDDSIADTDAFLDNTLFGHTENSYNYTGGDKAAYLLGVLAVLENDTRIENRADMGQLYAMAFNGDYAHAKGVLDGITADPNSVQTVLVGLHNQHVLSF